MMLFTFMYIHVCMYVYILINISIVWVQWIYVCCCCLVAKSCPTILQPHGLSLLCQGFPRQEYWSGLLFSSPVDLPDTRIKPTFPALQVDFLPLRQHIHSFSRYSSHIGHYRILSRIPCAIHRFLLITYFLYSTMKISVPISPFIPLPSLSLGNRKLVSYICKFTFVL